MQITADKSSNKFVLLPQHGNPPLPAYPTAVGDAFAGDENGLPKKPTGHGAAAFALPGAAQGLRGRLEQAFEQTDFYRGLTAGGPDHFLDLLGYAFNPMAAPVDYSAAFEDQKTRLAAMAGGDRPLAGQVIKKSLWQLAESLLPLNLRTTLREKVAAAEAKLKSGGDYPGYLADNQAVVNVLRGHLLAEEKMRSEISGSVFINRLQALDYHERLSVLARSYSSGSFSALSQEYTKFKNALLESARSDANSIDPLIRQEMWGQVFAVMPHDKIEAVSMELQNIRAQFEADNDEETYLSRTRELIKTLSREARLATMDMPHVSLLTPAEYLRLRDAVACGQCSAPQELMAFFMGSVDKLTDEKKSEIKKREKISLAIFHVKQMEILQQNAQRFLDAANLVIRKLANDPEIQKTSEGGVYSQQQLDEYLKTGLKSFTALLSALASDTFLSLFKVTLQECALLPNASVADFKTIIDSSMVARLGKEIHHGYERGTRLEEERVMEFYTMAMTVMPGLQSKMALGEALQNLIAEFKVNHAYAIADKQDLPPDLRSALVDSAASYVQHWYGFMREPLTAKSAAAPNGAPTTTSLPADVPVHIYREAVDALEEGTDLDRADPNFVSGGDYLARTNALYVVMNAEKAAYAAGAPFDRAGFVDASSDPTVLAAAGYLGTLFAAWQTGG